MAIKGLTIPGPKKAMSPRLYKPAEEIKPLRADEIVGDIAGQRKH